MMDAEKQLPAGMPLLLSVSIGVHLWLQIT